MTIRKGKLAVYPSIPYVLAKQVLYVVCFVGGRHHHPLTHREERCPHNAPRSQGKGPISPLWCGKFSHVRHLEGSSLTQPPGTGNLRTPTWPVQKITARTLPENSWRLLCRSGCIVAEQADVTMAIGRFWVKPRYTSASGITRCEPEPCQEKVRSGKLKQESRLSK